MTGGSPQPARALVLGAVHLDVKCHPASEVTPGTSTPGEVRFTPGGVARNIAHNLALIGLEVALAGRIGPGAAEDAVLSRTAVDGVDVSLVDRRAGASGAYVAVLGADGDLRFAIADGTAVESIDPVDVDGLAAALAGAHLVVLDCNLTDATLTRAIAHARTGRALIGVDCVSVPKASRLAAALRSGAPPDVIWCNRDELAALTRMPVAGAGQADAAARSLVDLGVRLVLVGLGPDGVAVVDAASAVRVPAAARVVRDVTGGGDAAFAATLAALLAGDGAARAAERGQEAAARAVASLETVAGRDPAAGPAPLPLQD